MEVKNWSADCPVRRKLSVFQMFVSCLYCVNVADVLLYSLQTCVWLSLQTNLSSLCAKYKYFTFVNSLSHIGVLDLWAALGHMKYYYYMKYNYYMKYSIIWNINNWEITYGYTVTLVLWLSPASGCSATDYTPAQVFYR